MVAETAWLVFFHAFQDALHKSQVMTFESRHDLAKSERKRCCSNTFGFYPFYDLYVFDLRKLSELAFISKRSIPTPDP